MLPVIFGCKGPRISDAERAFFRDADPHGFILFARNCETPEQIRALSAELRDSVGRMAPILVDQEGGRVQRLKPPLWRKAPAAARFGELFLADPEAARRAVWLNARLIAEELIAVGIDVDCLPCLDLQWPEGHAVIGDRSFSADVETVVSLGRAQVDGLAAGGVAPVNKHLPGHGRTRVDSHLDLPQVTASHAELSASDFQPFRAFTDLSMAMTGHLLFQQIDDTAPATQSARVIEEVIRGEIGFDGLLMTDDLSMQALEGSLGERARRSLDAGCDIALHCNGDMLEMTDIADRLGAVTGRTAGRVQAADARRASVADGRESLDWSAALAELEQLLN
jgi:beta-N-acetylhexosaminidase